MVPAPRRCRRAGAGWRFEGTPAQVVHGDYAFLASVQTVANAAAVGCSPAAALPVRLCARRLGRLPLSVVEIGRTVNNGLRHRLSQIHLAFFLSCSG